MLLKNQKFVWLTISLFSPGYYSWHSPLRSTNVMVIRSFSMTLFFNSRFRRDFS